MQLQSIGLIEEGILEIEVLFIVIEPAFCTVRDVVQ